MSEVPLLPMEISSAILERCFPIGVAGDIAASISVILTRIEPGKTKEMAIADIVGILQNGVNKATVRGVLETYFSSLSGDIFRSQ